jgi:hypothetical protein
MILPKVDWQAALYKHAATRPIRRKAKIPDTDTTEAPAMNTHRFRPSKRGAFLTSLQGCIYGVSEMMCIHCFRTASNFIPI